MKRIRREGRRLGRERRRRETSHVLKLREEKERELGVPLFFIIV